MDRIESPRLVRHLHGTANDRERMGSGPWAGRKALLDVSYEELRKGFVGGVSFLGNYGSQQLSSVTHRSLDFISF